MQWDGDYSSAYGGPLPKRLPPTYKSKPPPLPAGGRDCAVLSIRSTGCAGSPAGSCGVAFSKHPANYAGSAVSASPFRSPPTKTTAAAIHNRTTATATCIPVQHPTAVPPPAHFHRPLVPPRSQATPPSPFPTVTSRPAVKIHSSKPRGRSLLSFSFLPNRNTNVSRLCLTFAFLTGLVAFAIPLFASSLYSGIRPNSGLAGRLFSFFQDLQKQAPPPPSALRVSSPWRDPRLLETLFGVCPSTDLIYQYIDPKDDVEHHRSESIVNNMSILSDQEELLLAKARAIGAEFVCEPEQVAKGVREYLRLMARLIDNSVPSIDLGLAEHGQAMTMIPTYVTAVPNGTEKGVYLAVDLGGTNFRVCSIDLHGDSKFTLTQAKTPIPKELMTGNSKELFSFLAKQVALFIEKHHSNTVASATPNHHLKLGFTFSFPVDQVALNKGHLLRWTKGFDIPDAVGQDVCDLLQKEINILGLPVRVVALVNDTVGTLMARSYASPGKSGTLLGAIFGTGTNGAYVEKLSRIPKLRNAGNFDNSTGVMVINTEWGAFDNAMKVLPDTPYDRALDKNSVNPGMQMFEKRVSGMFLGEILRNAIVALMDHGLFKTAHGTSIDENGPLFTAWSIDTSALSTIQADYTSEYTLTKQLLEQQLGISAATTGDAMAIKTLVYGIGKRSARLSAIPIAATALATGAYDNYKKAKIGAAPGEEVEKIDIGVDGSVVEYYPGFERYLREALRDIQPLVPGAAGLEDAIRIGIAKDGSGVGAALIALVA
ncbi:Glucokinase [Drechslerella dactyloides]|uniref:glucokinase n=1 Tax=Drechslerella dactyloides TaxID=74499 RepID=A0AAD6J0F8_DREDA|nr:Glucokinase [Drechslerella dactyloides]